MTAKIAQIWRKLFPVRVEYVPQYRDPGEDFTGHAESIIPELAKAQKNSPEMFIWLFLRLKDLEGKFHSVPKIETDKDLHAYGVEQFALSRQIRQIRDIITLPASASAAIKAKKSEIDDADAGKNTNWG